jgi:hypothetical protein
MRAY